MSDLITGPGKLFKIAKAFVRDEIISVASFGSGAINETYLVICRQNDGGYPACILQRLHPVFRSDVLEDIEAVTAHLVSKRLLTPRLLKTVSGTLGYIDSDSSCWRMLTFVSGRSFDRKLNKKQANSAAALVGRFHNALADLDYEFRHSLPGSCNTPARISKLSETLSEFSESEKYPALGPMAQDILRSYKSMKKTIQGLPNRVIHGDLKISNIRFSKDGNEAVCLLDLDTLARYKILKDLGDACRSWCNPAGEDSPLEAHFDLNIFEAFVEGYSTTAEFVTQAELKAIPEGIETIILELSARFVTDAFRESYFRLDSSRYPSLFEQNRTRAETQLALYYDFQSKRTEVGDIIKRIASC